MEKFETIVKNSKEFKDAIEEFLNSSRTFKDKERLDNKIKDIKILYYDQYIKNIDRLTKNMGADLDSLDTNLTMDYSLISNTTLKNKLIDPKVLKEIEVKAERYKKIAMIERDKRLIAENSWKCIIL
jgi:hypothetical protein